MNKYSFIALALSIVLGFAAGAVFSSKQKNKEISKLMKEHEQALQKQIADSKMKIEDLTLKIKTNELLVKQDSIKIKTLEYKIKLDGVRYEQKLKEIQKLTPDEKVDWFINRYAKPTVNQ